MPSVDFQEFLERKYQVLQQQADATSQLKGAQAENLQTQTGLAPDLAQATITKQNASAGLDFAKSDLTGAQTKIANRLLSPIGEKGAALAKLLQGRGGRGAAGQRTRGNAITRGLTTDRKTPSGITSSLSVLPRDSGKLEEARRRRNALFGR